MNFTPDVQNLFVGVYEPGSMSYDIVKGLAHFRKIFKMSVKDLAKNASLSSATIEKIENNTIANPSFNTILKMMNGLGLCATIDMTANTLRREDGMATIYDSPAAIYGDAENPMAKMGELLTKVKKLGHVKTADLSAISAIPPRVLQKMFKGENVQFDTVLRAIAYFDFTMGVELDHYHRVWDLIGKTKEVAPNPNNMVKYDTRFMQRERPFRDPSTGRFAPAFRDNKGEHILFKNGDPMRAIKIARNY